MGFQIHRPTPFERHPDGRTSWDPDQARHLPPLASTLDEYERTGGTMFLKRLLVRFRDWRVVRDAHGPCRCTGTCQHTRATKFDSSALESECEFFRVVM